MRIIALAVLEHGSYGAILFAETPTLVPASVPSTPTAEAMGHAIEALKHELKSMVAKGIIILVVGGVVSLFLPHESNDEIQCRVDDFVEFQHHVIEAKSAQRLNLVVNAYCKKTKGVSDRVLHAFELE